MVSIMAAPDDLHVADGAHQPKSFIFPKRSFGTKGEKRAFNPAWFSKWITMKQTITLFDFTAHMRIEGTIYQMVSARSVKKHM